jgi:hypothetical protein
MPSVIAPVLLDGGEALFAECPVAFSTFRCRALNDRSRGKADMPRVSPPGRE